jgi:hypothetical protein
MDERLARIIGNIATLNGLAQFEANARRQNALDEEMRSAIKARSGELGRALVAERTGLDLTNLSPAEKKIVEAVSEYVGVMKKDGKDATRTLIQLKNRGLTAAAEAAVSRSAPTRGFQTLADADLLDLSYEQIIVDHPEEFSQRAIWFSRRTLGLPNDSDRSPPTSEPTCGARWRPRSVTPWPSCGTPSPKWTPAISCSPVAAS